MTPEPMKMPALTVLSPLSTALRSTSLGSAVRSPVVLIGAPLVTKAADTRLTRLFTLPLARVFSTG